MARVSTWRRSVGVASWLVAATAGGCATAPPVSPERALELQLARTCPEDENIAGTGISSSGVTEAEQQARADVSRRIASRLKAELLLDQRAVVEEEGGVESARFAEERRNRVVEQTAFAHADLIRTSPLPPRADGTSLVVACLPRAAAGERLHGDLKLVTARVDAAEARAQQAAAQQDRAAFASAWQEFLDALGATRPLLLQLRAVLQRPSPVEAELGARRSALGVEAQRLREGLAFHLDVEADKLPRESRDRLRSTVEQALVMIAPVVAKRTCTSASAAVAVVAEVEPNCRRGTLGQTCTPALSARVKDCRSDAAPLTGVLSERELSGAHTGDAGKALARALEVVDVAQTHQALRRLVARLVPLEPDMGLEAGGGAGGVTTGRSE